MSIEHEVEAIPQELGSLVKGDIKLGKIHVPKIALVGGVVGVVAFFAIRAGRNKQSPSLSASTSNNGIGNSNPSGTNDSPQDSNLSGLGDINVKDDNIGNNPLAAIPTLPDLSGYFGFGNDNYGVPDVSGIPSLQLPDLSNSNVPYFSGYSDVGNTPQPPIQNIVASSTGLANVNKVAPSVVQNTQPTPIAKVLNSLNGGVVVGSGSLSNNQSVITKINNQVNKISDANLASLTSAVNKINPVVSAPKPIPLPVPVQNVIKPYTPIVNGITSVVNNFVKAVTPQPKVTVAPVPVPLPKPVPVPVQAPKPSPVIPYKPIVLPKPIPVPVAPKSKLVATR